MLQCLFIIYLNIVLHEVCFFKCSYHNKKQTLEIRQHEVETVRIRIQQSLHHQYQTEIQQLEVSLGKLYQMIYN